MSCQILTLKNKRCTKTAKYERDDLKLCYIHVKKYDNGSLDKARIIEPDEKKNTSAIKKKKGEKKGEKDEKKDKKRGEKDKKKDKIPKCDLVHYLVNDYDHNKTRGKKFEIPDEIKNLDKSLSDEKKIIFIEKYIRDNKIKVDTPFHIEIKFTPEEYALYKSYRTKSSRNIRIGGYINAMKLYGLIHDSRKNSEEETVLLNNSFILWCTLSYDKSFAPWRKSGIIR